MIENSQSYSPGEAAVVCSVPRRTILAAIKAGRLRAARFNARVIRISRNDLLAWRIELTGQTQHATTRTTRIKSPNSA